MFTYILQLTKGQTWRVGGLVAIWEPLILDHTTIGPICISPSEILATTLGQKKNIVLPSATNPSPKVRGKKSGSGMHLIFVRLGVFSPFWRKNDAKCTQMLYFCVLFENKWLKKIYFLTDQPKYLDIPLEGNSTIFFFWPYMGYKYNVNILKHDWKNR